MIVGRLYGNNAAIGIKNVRKVFDAAPVPAMREMHQAVVIVIAEGSIDSIGPGDACDPRFEIVLESKTFAGKGNGGQPAGIVILILGGRSSLDSHGRSLAGGIIG